MVERQNDGGGQELNLDYRSGRADSGCPDQPAL
jgi:hypothetical protein